MKSMTRNFKKLKTYLINTEAYKNSFDYAFYKTDSVALFNTLSSTDSAVQQMKYQTSLLCFQQDKPFLASGKYYTNKSVEPFIASINDTLVSWIFTYKNPKNDTANIISLQYNSAGIQALFNYQNTDSISKIVSIKSNGKVNFEYEIKDKLKPVKLNYDELEKSYLVIYGQPVTDSNIQVENSLSEQIYQAFKIVKIDSTGNKIWENYIDIQGMFVEILRAKTAYQVYINKYHAPADAKHKKSALTWQLSINGINPDGEPLYQKTVKSPKSFYISNTYHISDNQFNLIGFESDLKMNKNGKLVYIIVNDKGELEYSNLFW